MAAITSAQAGNWSVATTWTGGVVPGSGDTVTVAHSVTADTDINIAALTFNSITAQLFVTESRTINVSGAITMTVNSATVSYGINITAASGTVAITATGLIRSVGAHRMIYSGGGASVYVGAYGGLAGGTTGSGATLWVASTAPVTVWGVVDIAVGSTHEAIRVSVPNATLTVRGSIIASATNNAGYGIRCQGDNLTLNIENGDTPGNISPASAIRTAVLVEAARAVIHVAGIVTSSTAAAAYGIGIQSTSGTITVDGGITAAGAAAVYVVSNGLLNIGGAMIASAAGTLPYRVAELRLVAGKVTSWSLPDESGDMITLTNQATGTEPAETNVRLGVAYRGGRIGSMAVPTPAQVVAGIAVDDAVGTAILDMQTFAAISGAQIAAAVGRN